MTSTLKRPLYWKEQELMREMYHLETEIRMKAGPGYTQHEPRTEHVKVKGTGFTDADGSFGVQYQAVP